MPADDLLSISPAVKAALAAKRPVVALESTIITHGMPYPHNLETAQRVEAVVAANGALPATIGVLAGKLVVGMDADQLAALASDTSALKASRKDLSAAIAKRANAGTTVAATMAIAHRAGIALFATGGIGGVHRGGETTLDISADLIELSRTNVAVVCAGAKSILDIGRTLEFLETHGVPIFGFQCDDFPAFYARSSGHRLDHRFESEHKIAQAIKLQGAIGPAGSLIVAPPPANKALPEAAIEAKIRAALADAERDGVRGKSVTPYLLRRVVELSDGQSLTANMALIENNAALAARIAVALAAL